MYYPSMVKFITSLLFLKAFIVVKPNELKRINNKKLIGMYKN